MSCFIEIILLIEKYIYLELLCHELKAFSLLHDCFLLM